MPFGLHFHVSLVSINANGPGGFEAASNRRAPPWRGMGLYACNGARSRSLRWLRPAGGCLGR